MLLGLGPVPKLRAGALEFGAEFGIDFWGCAAAARGGRGRGGGLGLGLWVGERASERVLEVIFWERIASMLWEGRGILVHS